MSFERQEDEQWAQTYKDREPPNPPDGVVGGMPQSSRIAAKLEIAEIDLSDDEPSDSMPQAAVARLLDWD